MPSAACVIDASMVSQPSEMPTAARIALQAPVDTRPTHPFRARSRVCEPASCGRRGDLASAATLRRVQPAQALVGPRRGRRDGARGRAGRADDYAQGHPQGGGAEPRGATPRERRPATDEVRALGRRAAAQRGPDAPPPRGARRDRDRAAVGGRERVRRLVLAAAADARLPLRRDAAPLPAVHAQRRPAARRALPGGALPAGAPRPSRAFDERALPAHD